MPDFFPWLLLQFFATAALAGLIWTVQLAIYPRFADIPEEIFVGYHRRYCEGIGLVVAPLILLELVTSIAWWVVAPYDPAAMLGLALIGLHLLSTLLFQVPLHRRLMRGREDAAIRRLVRTNWIRTAAWSARAALLGLVLTGKAPS